MKKVVQTTILVLLLLAVTGSTYADFHITHRGSIRGAVYLDSDGDGQCSNRDLPVYGVDILFVPHDNSSSTMLYSGTNGTYGLVSAPLGEWIVTAVPPTNEWIVTSANPLTVFLTEDNNRLLTNVNFCVIHGADTPNYAKPIATETDFSANHAISTALLSSKESASISTTIAAHSDTETASEETIVDVEEAAEPITNLGPEWLAYLNEFREMGDLPLLQEINNLTNGSLLHSRYMVVNDKAISHSEAVDNPLYDPSGHQAAINGNIFATSQLQADYKWGINFWVSAPFHLLGIIDPELESVGYGNHNQAIGTFHMAAVLDVGSERGNSASTVEYPLYFPGEGSTTHVVRRSLYEWPDPLGPCPGYSIPTGPPLVLQLGDGSLTPNVTDHTLLRNGAPVESCIFDETTYTNSDGYAQGVGRSILDLRDAVVVTPKEPLEGGATYTVQITANGQSYAWNFTVRKP
ncbi:MAG: hypothetical protein GY943_36585 [Chloroflexi bacterium]|nr:hypothetical protein [Chloroflexota bacterium]